MIHMHHACDFVMNLLPQQTKDISWPFSNTTTLMVRHRIPTPIFKSLLWNAARRNNTAKIIPQEWLFKNGNEKWGVEVQKAGWVLRYLAFEYQQLKPTPE